jgi:D-glycero-D-manno-heptose 1,7-bisphosphate phosphatase
MRVLLAIKPGEERLWDAARALDERGHEVTVLASSTNGCAWPFLVHEGRWEGWRGAYGAGRILAERKVELAVAEDARTLGLLRWARRLHPSTGISAVGGADGETVERELEAVRAAHRRYERAVFLDRDGTLMPEVGALGRPEAVQLMPGAAAALRALSAARYELVVVSNQSAIGRGVVTAEQVRNVNAALRRMLRAEGVELSGIFVCPHRPEDGCSCRKPLPGLLLQAATMLGLSLKRSWLIGDSTRDTQAAAAAGVRGILLQTGWGGVDPAAPSGQPAPLRVRDWRAAVARVVAT